MDRSDDDVFVRLKGVSKEFSGVRVLNSIDLEFRNGEIHSLVGENGAGKSTVGKIVGGYYSRSSGQLDVGGAAVPGNWNSATALRAGIAMMHQELQLVPELTVAQNVFLGAENNRLGFLRKDEAVRMNAIVDICGFDIDPAARAGSLSIADQQKIEIMRAIARDARMIVMDEPTSSLTADEADRLHATMQRLRSMGRSIIYVSHFLDHVLAVSDRVTIMREGSVVRTAAASDETKATLVQGMLGRAASEVGYPAKRRTPEPTGAALLRAEGLASKTGVKEATLEVYPGEVVGLIGLVGSGRTEIARTIFGADASTAGRVFIKGVAYDQRSPRSSIRRGLCMVPEDRRKQGLVMTQTVRPNMTLAHLDVFSRAGMMQRDAERSAVGKLIDYFDVNPKAVDGEVANYSGGNQQKVLLAKWIINDPDLVILDEPSRGVDLGARRRIHEFIVDLASRGKGVLLISSEIEEVLGLSHRAYLMKDGRVIDQVEPEETNMEKVLWTLFHEEGGKQAGELG